VADYTQHPGGDAWVEVEADGLYLIDLRAEHTSITKIPQYPRGSANAPELCFVGRLHIRQTLTNILSLYRSQISTEQ
jgi:hypothetical protein